MSKPKVSVIIPTLMRAPYCVRTVEDLMDQDYANLEVIIVEQETSHDEVADLARRFMGKVFYHFEVKSTAPRNKNIGAKHATGELLYFLDDDCRLPEDFISKSVDALFSEEGVGAVSGKIIQPSEPLEVGPEGVVGKVSSYGSITTNYATSTRCYIDTAHGCSIYKREVFEKVGGFDENFDGNAMREETDFSMRVARAGYKLLFEPKIEFVHVKAPMGGTRRKQNRMEWYFDFFHNDLLFFLKNREWKWMPVFFASKARPILSCMFYYGKARPSAIALPFRAYYAGYKTYKKEQSK